MPSRKRPVIEVTMPPALYSPSIAHVRTPIPRPGVGVLFILMGHFSADMQSSLRTADLVIITIMAAFTVAMMAAPFVARFLRRRRARQRRY